MGCTQGYGAGHGAGNANCPGSGGAHGGTGGYGSAGTSSTSCINFVPHPYFSEGSAIFEGSSGGRGNTTTGGSGGGIIWLSATGNITLNKTQLNVTG